MIFVRIGQKMVRTKKLRIDTYPTVYEDDGVETVAEREARVQQKEHEIQEGLKHQKRNQFGLI